MTDLLLKTTELKTNEMVEHRTVRFAERPITFEEFLDLTGEDDDIELIDGVLVEKMAVQLEHEKLYAWLFTVMNVYTQKRAPGIILGSRTAVEIDQFKGRLPDLLFVRRERMAIVQEKAIYGAPDLVIEIVSPGDRPSDLTSLEADYRRLGVSEIVFINRMKGHIRFLHKRESDYEQKDLKTGTFQFEAIEDLALQVEWLLNEPRPDMFDLLTALLAPKEA